MNMTPNTKILTLILLAACLAATIAIAGSSGQVVGEVLQRQHSENAHLFAENKGTEKLIDGKNEEEDC
jgi:hypothetical protein